MKDRDEHPGEEMQVREEVCSLHALSGVPLFQQLHVFTTPELSEPGIWGILTEVS